MLRLHHVVKDRLRQALQLRSEVAIWRPPQAKQVLVSTIDGATHQHMRARGCEVELQVPRALVVLGSSANRIEYRLHIAFIQFMLRHVFHERMLCRQSLDATNAGAMLQHFARQRLVLKGGRDWDRIGVEPRCSTSGHRERGQQPLLLEFSSRLVLSGSSSTRATPFGCSFRDEVGQCALPPEARIG